MKTRARPIASPRFLSLTCLKYNLVSLQYHYLRRAKYIIPTMATNTLPVTPPDEIKEMPQESKRLEDPSMRQSEKLEQNGVTHHDYVEPTGAPSSRSAGAIPPKVTSNRSFGALGSQNPDSRRREIRDRVRRKYRAKAPSLRWTKFMHSQTKNSKTFSSFTRYRFDRFDRYRGFYWRIYWHYVVPLLRLRWNSTGQYRNR